MIGLLAALILAQAKPALQLGQPAPALEAHEVEGAKGKFDLTKLRGKVVVLEFWATWCAPCIDQFPHINQVAKSLAGEPVEFVSVSIDEGQDADAKVLGLLKQRPLETRVVVAEANTKKLYGLDSIPTTVVLDRLGNVESVTSPRMLTEQALRSVIDGRPSGLINPLQAAKPEGPTKATEPSLLSVSVKRSNSEMMGGFSGPTGFLCNGATLPVLASQLYGVSSKKVVVEGPEPEGKWDVEVKFPAAMRNSLMLVLPSMIEAAVGFTAKTEEREMEVYTVTCPAGGQVGPMGELRASTYAGEGHWSRGTGVVAGVKAPLPRFMAQIEQVLGIALVDRSGLAGEFDYRLTFAEGDSASLVAALADAGLVLKREKAKLPVLVLRVKG